MNRLDADLTLPHPLKPALLGASGAALPPPAAALAETLLGAESLAGLGVDRSLAEGRARGAEDGAAC